MIVLKFGGTSVGTSESLANVKKIVESLDDDAIVVVSALGGLTDCLIATASMAASGDPAYRQEWMAIHDRHLNIIADVIPEKFKEETTNEVSPLLNELKRLYDGISLIEYLPQQTLDRVVSLGERMSSIIVARMIKNATHANSLDIIKTERWFDKNIASGELTNENICRELGGKSYPIVMGGFISTDKDSGEITNLGRGGSDYTAALVAAALDADVLQIWTDVDGFMTCDPRIVANARVIPEMSFVESMDLCNFGAKVIYPPTIYPVFHKNIPIRILNTHRPEAPGTLITDRPRSQQSGITGITALKGQSLITIRGRLVYDATAVIGRSFNALGKKGISAHIQSKAGLHNSFSLAVASTEAAAALALLNEEFAPELSSKNLESITRLNELAIIAAVGDNIGKTASLPSKIRNILAENEVETLTFSDKASETALTFVIYEKDVPNALRAIHNII